MLPAVKVEHLWKEYVVGQSHDRHATFYDTLSNALKAPFRKRDETLADPTKFWALNDVSFEVQPGEVVGIIGRNGAGKSTLLKVLSRITAPTKGRVEVRGRLASLLEVGTGFHGELSGRENIFLNGAILGMSRKDIAKKFDEIVAFAEVEKFIDTPVKRYSSGMYVRLAFAVAAHLDPEILIVDEVLAVGDAKFQQKCLRFLGEAGEEGRTVLLVTHTMSAIETLCKKVIEIDAGQIRMTGTDVKRVIGEYMGRNSGEASVYSWPSGTTCDEKVPVLPRRMYLTTNEEFGKQDASNVDDISYTFEFDLFHPDEGLLVGVRVETADNQVVFESFATDVEQKYWPKFQLGSNRLQLKIPRRLLNEGRYFFYPSVSVRNREWILKPSVNDGRVALRIVGGMSDSPYWGGNRPGVIAPVLRWARA